VFAANFWLNPASGTFSQGQNISIGIGVNTGGEYVNAAQVNLTYAKDKFDFVSLSTGGSALTIIAEKSGGGGQIRIGGGAPTPGFSGSKLIATVTLKAKVSSGSTQISFNSDSAILRNSDSQDIKSGSPGFTYNFRPAAITTPLPTASPNKPVATTQTTALTIEPTANTVLPIATQPPRFFDQISTPVLYGLLAISLIGSIVCIIYLISSVILRRTGG